MWIEDICGSFEEVVINFVWENGKIFLIDYDFFFEGLLDLSSVLKVYWVWD